MENEYSKRKEIKDGNKNFLNINDISRKIKENLSNEVPQEIELKREDNLDSCSDWEELEFEINFLIEDDNETIVKFKLEYEPGEFREHSSAYSFSDYDDECFIGKLYHEKEINYLDYKSEPVFKIESDEVGGELELCEVDFDELVDRIESFFNVKKSWLQIDVLKIKGEEDNTARICKIEVNESPEFIFNVNSRNNISWITLARRANGRTIKVDPREYIENQK